MAVSFRLGSLNDASDIALVHEAAFEGFFLTSLGTRFLTQFYRSHLLAGAVTVVALSEGRVVGFSTGLYPLEGRSRALISASPAGWAMTIFRMLVERPRACLALLVRAKEVDHSERPPSVPREAILLASIGVLPEFEGQGVGRNLISRFHQESERRGYPWIVLETDTIDNEEVNAFYLRAGYDLAGTRTDNRGRVLNIYTKDIR